MLSVVALVVLSWAMPSAAAIQPQTHFDSLWQTDLPEPLESFDADWPCVDGVGGTPALPTNGFCVTDSAVTSWYSDAPDGSSGDINNPGTIENVLENAYEPTALTMSRTFNPKFSGTGETDIFYQAGEMHESGIPGVVVLGMTWCNDAQNGECDQHYVRFRSHTPDAVLICHESGHAVGLTHGQNASPQQDNDDPAMYCMRTPHSLSYAPTIGASLTTQLNAHYVNQ